MTAPTMRQAQQRLATLQASLDQGTDPRTYTVRQWGEAWRTEQDYQQAPRTAAWYSENLTSRIDGPLGRIRLTRLTPADVRAWQTRLAREGVSEAGRHRAFRALRACSKAAYQAGHIDSDPFARLTAPRAGRPRSDWHPPDQMRLVLQQAATADTRDRVLVALLYAGLRRGEALGVRWSDLDLDAATLTVEQQVQRVGGTLVTRPLKTAHSRRTVPLTSEAVTALKAHRVAQAEARLAASEWADLGLVLTTDSGRPVDPRQAQRTWVRLQKAAKVPVISLHGARRSAVSALALSGASVRTAAAIAGHDPRLSLAIYQQVDQSHMTEAVDRLGQLLSGTAHD